MKNLSLIITWGILLGIMEVAAGSGVQLTRAGEKYRLVAHDALLSEVLQRIDAMEEATLRFLGDQERTVNAVYHDVTLDQLLYRLGVSYMLVYEPGPQGDFHLRNGVMGSGENRLFGDVSQVQVEQWIRDLAHDNVRWNAHKAQGELFAVGCEIVPLLEEALYVSDYQGRHSAAQILRLSRCPDYVPSDKLLEVTLQLLGRDQYDPNQYWSLFTPTDAFEYLHALEGEAYDRVRGRLVQNLNHADRQKRFLSAALLAEHSETEWAAMLVHILAAHLADNDLPTDGGVAAHALYRLGSVALPYLRPYRQSSDPQQAELANLICSALEAGEIPRFVPVMYAGTPINPLRQRQIPRATRWRQEQFPDTAGRYHNLREPRRTTLNYFGQGYNTELADIPEQADSMHTHFHPRISRIPNATRKSGSAEWDSETAQEKWEEDKPFPYTTCEGDTLETLARAFAIKLKTLLDINPDIQIATDEIITPGTTVLIPPLR